MRKIKESVNDTINIGNKHFHTLRGLLRKHLFKWKKENWQQREVQEAWARKSTVNSIEIAVLHC